MTVSRRLAEARCAKRGHLLAAVTIENGRYLAHLPKMPVERSKSPGAHFTDRHATADERVDLTAIDAAKSTFVTCGCGDDFPIDLLELRRRATRGDEKPLICHPVVPLADTL